jgi:diacylglycerol kinase (ATP)
VVINGTTQRIYSLVISSVERMAKVLKIASGAQADDGLLHVSIVPARSKALLIERLMRAMTRGLNTMSAKRYEFQIKDAMPMQADGEVLELEANASVSVSLAEGGLVTLGRAS